MIESMDTEVGGGRERDTVSEGAEGRMWMAPDPMPDVSDLIEERKGPRDGAEEEEEEEEDIHISR